MLKPNSKETPNEENIRNNNFWYIVLLITFILVWISGAYVYFHPKTNNPPVVVLDVMGGIDLTNSLRMSPTNTSIVRPMYEIREKYERGEIVIIKYFYLKAVVLDEPTNDFYEVLYKNHGTLQKITLPRHLLMHPVDGDLNPVSLLLD
jgi:hypothetical protein